MTHHDAFLRCAALAATQFGVISGEQAEKLGLKDDALARRVREGALQPLFRGTYRLAGVPASWRGRLLAAQLTAGAGAIVSHRSAAALYGLDGAPEGPIELLVRTGNRRVGIIQHRLRDDDDPSVRTNGPFTVTGPERTLLDLAAVLPIRRVGLAMDHALRKKLTTLDRLWTEVRSEGAKGRNGTRNFRKLLGTRDGRDEKIRSDFEKHMLRITKRIDKQVKADFKVESQRQTYYFDFAFPQRKLGIECQSIDWHLGDEKIKKDGIRDRRLKKLGWTVLYFFWDEVVFTPDVVERDIREVLALPSSPV